jgi:hypothetical protein
VSGFGSIDWQDTVRRTTQFIRRSLDIERLKAAARNSLLPAYYLEPLNDASPRPAVVLGKAAGDQGLADNRACRVLVRAQADLDDASKSRKIATDCPFAGIERRMARSRCLQLLPPRRIVHRAPSLLLDRD